MSKSVRQLEDELQDLLDEATAIQTIADRDQGGEFLEDQRKRWDQLMADGEKPEEKGVIAKKRAEVEARARLEAEKNNLAQHRRSLRDPSNLFAQDGRKAPEPRVVSRLGKLKAFEGGEAERDAYDCGMWLRAMVAQARHVHDERAELRLGARGWGIRAAHTEGTPTEGGFLVPDPLSNAIINYRALSGISRQICRVIPMTSDSLDIPKKTGTMTVYYPGEATDITESNQAFGRVRLNTVKRAVLSKISQELTDDAVINIIDDLAQEIGSDLAVQEDNELINGTGTSSYGGVTGLLQSIGAAGVFVAGGSTSSGRDTWPEIQIGDFTSTMAVLPARHRAAMPVWLASPAFYDSVMLRLQAEAGGNIFTTIQQGGGNESSVGPNGRFLGYPVYLTDQMPTATAVTTISCLFGAFNRAAMIGDRMGVRIGLSDQYAFNEDVITVRATSRYDINVHEEGDASAAGAYVALKTSTT